MEFSLETLNEFDIPSIIDATIVTNGKSASTYLLHTNTTKKFILKSINTKEQGEFEYKFLQHIRTKDNSIVSEILTTKDGKPYIQIDERLYQLQVYVPSIKEKAPLQKVLEAYQILEKSIGEFRYEQVRPNRFALDVLWEDTKAQLHDNFPGIYDEISLSIEEWTALDNNQSNWIHGDLGAWNLLLTEARNICFIDFSEARKGTKYFDLVAIFASYLPQNSEDFHTYTQEFFLAYEASVDRMEFYQTVELWYVKGILSLLKMEIQSTKTHILYFYDILRHFRALHK